MVRTNVNRQIPLSNADAFRIYEGDQLTGDRSWGTRTGTGTMKGREAPIELAGNYTCTWTEHSNSSLPGNRGKFRLLSFTRDLHHRDPAGSTT